MATFLSSVCECCILKLPCGSVHQAVGMIKQKNMMNSILFDWGINYFEDFERDFK